MLASTGSSRGWVHVYAGGVYMYGAYVCTLVCVRNRNIVRFRDKRFWGRERTGEGKKRGEEGSVHSWKGSLGYMDFENSVSKAKVPWTGFCGGVGRVRGSGLRPHGVRYHSEEENERIFFVGDTRSVITSVTPR